MCASGHGAPFDLEHEMTRTNALQRTIDEAHAERAYQADLAAIRVRESIRPLERRRLDALAQLVRQQGWCRRAA